MPFSFRTERAIDDPTVQSIFYGPTLLVVQSPPVGESLQDGLLEAWAAGGPAPRQHAEEA